MNKSLILCGALAAAGCAQKQPPVVAVVPTPAPTPIPLPTQAPIVIQSNEPPPPAMFQVAPDQPFAQQPTRRTRRANRVAQRPRAAAPMESPEPNLTLEQKFARAGSAAIYDVFGGELERATTSEEVSESLDQLQIIRDFYKQQRNNPTMMSQQKANNNVVIIDQLIAIGNLKLDIVSDSVPANSRGVMKMNLASRFTQAKGMAGALDR